MSPMKIAVQIYGGPRCFDKTIQDFLQKIGYFSVEHKFDFYILYDDKNNYDRYFKNDNLTNYINSIETLLSKDLKFFEPLSKYPDYLLEEENLIQGRNGDLRKISVEKNIKMNKFFDRLYMRRNFLNKLRKQIDKDYDLIIVTRFDITIQSDLYKLYENIGEKDALCSLDIFTAAKPALFDIIEDNIMPYYHYSHPDYENYLDFVKINRSTMQYTFMPEKQLQYLIHKSGWKINRCKCFIQR